MTLLHCDQCRGVQPHTYLASRTGVWIPPPMLLSGHVTRAGTVGEMARHGTPPHNQATEHLWACMTCGMTRRWGLDSVAKGDHADPR